MSNDLIVAPTAGEIAERPEAIIARITQARETVIAIQEKVMKAGVHYGTIPGTDKPALLKAGADVLNMCFRLAPKEEEVVDLSGPDERRYKVTVGIYNQDGRRLGFGVGVCSTSEEKYRWRKAYQNEFDASPVERRRKKEYQRAGKTETILQIRTEPADLENTVLQMAAKRALVQATRQVHAVSDVFADITEEDLPEDQKDSLKLGGQKKVQQPKAKQSAPAPKPTANGAPRPAEPQAATATQATESTTAPAEQGSGTAFQPVIAPEKWAPVIDKWHEKGAISAAQSKRLYTIARQAGWSNDLVNAEIAAGLGVNPDDDGVLPLPWGASYDLTVAIFATPRPQ